LFKGRTKNVIKTLKKNTVSLVAVIMVVLAMATTIMQYKKRKQQETGLIAVGTSKMGGA
jgi:hypothetical protein